jgi:hypothetical protein
VWDGDEDDKDDINDNDDSNNNKNILKKWGARLGTGFVWLRIGAN